MHLSTSSSSSQLPKGHWFVSLLAVVCLLFLLVALFEWNLRHLGWRPSVVDSVERWSHQRNRVETLGGQSMILVGSSRIQLGLDLSLIREMTGMEPLQLAIDGSSFMPVLENLADDPSVTGMVVVDVAVHKVKAEGVSDRATQWLNYYRSYEQGERSLPPYKRVNNRIKSFFDENMVTRMEGARPFTVISTLAFKPTAFANYLVTYNDRSRDADYQKVLMPNFYAERVMRNFGRTLGDGKVSFAEFTELYSRAIQHEKPRGEEIFLSGLEKLMEFVHQIEQRGGRVILIRFPSDKLIWEMDNKRYPRKLFWDRLALQHKNSIHFRDYPELSGFDLPDGSHLDYRDKKEFTQALVNVMKHL